MMKNKKGFTLIEILAVIVVLAIIALITTPIINKYVYNSKQRSFEASIYSMFREYDYLGTNETLTVTEFNPCDFTNKQDCKFTGKIKVRVVDGKKVPFADDISNGDFCANGGSDDLVITDGYCGKNDTTAPVITSVEIINITSYSADVIVNINEPEGSITEHQYRLLDSNGNPITEWLTGDSITKNGDNYVSRKRYTDLAAGTKFYVEIRIKNNATSNNTTEKLYSNHEAYDFTTTTFARPTITYPTVWEKAKRVTLHYDKNVTSQYRIITEGNFHIGNWTDLTGEIYEMEVNNYHYIVEIKSTDGHTTYTSSAQIGYVDNEYDINNTPPKAEIKDYKNSTGVNTNEIALVLSDKLSGVKNYCISTTNEVSSCSGTGNNTTFGKWVSVSTTPEVRNITKPHVFVNGGTYYAFVEDYVGNKSSGYTVSFNRVHYDLNGGTGNVLDQVKVKDYTLVITDTIPTKSGYDFIGWDTDPTSHNPAYPSKSNYTKNEDVTLYAIWRRTITVKYDGNEGIGFLGNSTCYRYNAEPNCKIVLADNAFTRNGYTFKGWALGKSGNYTYEKNTEYAFSDNITVYAGWKVNALVFNNQTINVVYNTVDQELSYTGASNGNGNYSYSEVSENNSSNAATNYFTLAANNKIKMNKLTPVSTYTYVIKATSPVTYNIDNLTSVSANATITVKLTSFDIGTGSGLVIENIPNQTYTRNAIIPAITVKLNGTTLTNNTDYTYVATNNVNVGTATITVTGKGNYKGTKTATFAIVPYNISGSGSSVAAISDLTYNGSNQYPKPAVTALGKTLTENTEVKYTYENNKDAGTGTVTMTGTGNYTGTQTKNFTIKPKSIAVVWSGTTKTFNNANQKPSASVTTGVTNETMTLTVTGEQKNAGTNYSASTSCTSVTTNNRCANYTLTNASTAFVINPYNIANASMDSVAAVNYKGSAYTPTPTLKAFNVSLVNNTDYTYSYSNNINAGTATVTATGKGNYTGTKSVNFTINRIDPTKTQVDPITTTNLTYNGKDQGLVGTVNISNAKIFYSVGTALNASNYSTAGSETKPSRKDANTYTVYYYAPADNYNAQSGSFQVTIVPKALTVSWNTDSLVYNKNAQAPTPSVNTNISGETMSFNVSGSQTNVGSNYTASATCKSVTTNNRCDNYTLSETSKKFSITAKVLDVPSRPADRTYSGSTIYSNITCPDGSTASGTQSAINVGDYTQTCTLTSTTNYKWNVNNNVTSPQNIGWTIKRANNATQGNCVSGLVYNGSNQTIASGGTFVSYSNNSQKNAGQYSVTVTTDSNHTFSNGTTSTSYICTIAKKNSTLTIDSTSGTVIVGRTNTYKIKADVAGSFGNSSNATGIATVAPASQAAAANTNYTVTITGVASGTAIITSSFTPTDTTNYNTASKTYTATISPVYTVSVSCGNCTSNPTSREVTSGGSSSFTITANNGYMLTGAIVSGTGCSLSGSTLTATNVTSNRTCIVTAKPKYTKTTKVCSYTTSWSGTTYDYNLSSCSNYTFTCGPYNNNYTYSYCSTNTKYNMKSKTCNATYKFGSESTTYGLSSCDASTWSTCDASHVDQEHISCTDATTYSFGSETGPTEVTSCSQSTWSTCDADHSGKTHTDCTTTTLYTKTTKNCNTSTTYSRIKHTCQSARHYKKISYKCTKSGGAYAWVQNSWDEDTTDCQETSGAKCSSSGDVNSYKTSCEYLRTSYGFSTSTVSSGNSSCDPTSSFSCKSGVVGNSYYTCSPSYTYSFGSSSTTYNNSSCDASTWDSCDSSHSGKTHTSCSSTVQKYKTTKKCTKNVAYNKGKKTCIGSYKFGSESTNKGVTTCSPNSITCDSSHIGQTNVVCDDATTYTRANQTCYVTFSFGTPTSTTVDSCTQSDWNTCDASHNGLTHVSCSQ